MRIATRQFHRPIPKKPFIRMEVASDNTACQVDHLHVRIPVRKSLRNSPSERFAIRTSGWDRREASPPSGRKTVVRRSRPDWLGTSERVFGRTTARPYNSDGLPSHADAESCTLADMRTYPLGPRQADILDALAEHGPLTVRSIHRHVRTTSDEDWRITGNSTRHLRERGFVSITSTTGNRNAAYYDITAAGREAIERESERTEQIARMYLTLPNRRLRATLEDDPENDWPPPCGCPKCRPKRSAHRFHVKDANSFGRAKARQ